MKHCVFIVEGRSDETFLREFLPQIGIAQERFHVYSLGSKRRLILKFHLLLREWSRPDARFIILIDQDMDDCKQLKSQIENVAQEKCKMQSENLMVRIACREIEAWYLGDIAALEEAYPDVRSNVWRKIKRRQNPDDDRDPKPSDILGYIPDFSKQGAARKMGDIMARNWKSSRNNQSASFRCFVSGVMGMLGE